MSTLLRLVILVAAVAGLAAADITTSYTGTLASPESVVDFTISLASAGTVTLQTYGFGGGTNANHTVIAPGGTDPFLAVFAGTDGSAAIVTDGMGNAYGTSAIITNYADFTGCPPAGELSIGGSDVCADITMSLSLAAGIYTVVLSDGQYFANAIFDNGTLGEGFTDFTGGGFCNASINGVDCPNTSGDYALDITVPGVPEPSTVMLLGTVLAGLGLRYGRRRRA